MATLIVIWLLSLVVFTFGILLLSKKNFLLGVAVTAIGISILCAATFISAPFLLPTGRPLSTINGGTYKVAFVYIAGENVNVVIERKEDEVKKIVNRKEDEKEYLYLYQFPKSAFDSGSINSQAKKLVVVESGRFWNRFRKLVLE